MPFEARALRVQLPCGQVTVIEAAAHDAEVLAREYLRERFADANGCGNCSPVTDRCTGRSERIEDIMCANTEPLDFRKVVDVRILPILRKQLEEQLAVIAVAQAAVEKKLASSK
ncbi:MAG: hypothetical protein E8D40_17515 [Nitrospira sp.]|nr:MAG: hypothetical protein E8D40_17515 [Nitrospira sp.]